MAQQFYPIKVREVRKTTSDASVVTFDIPEDLEEVFQFKQGQHLTLKANVDGEFLRRSYSLCSSPLEKVWRVAVRQIQDGRFSSHVNNIMKAGDILDLMPPHGRFFCEIEKESKKHYVAFAAGSGITPILSIIKTHLTEEPQSTFSLFYMNRMVQSIMLREEVEGLKNTFLNRFELYHILNQESRNIPLFDGRLDEDKLTEMGEKILDYSAIDEYFLCGPAPMIFMVRDFLMEKGIGEKQIHFELFNTPVENTEMKTKSTSGTKGLTQVEVINNGNKMSFEMSQEGESVLDAALRHNADLPFACKGGVCCTCRAKIIEGEVEMKVNYALEEEEVADGYVLTCQSVPKTQKILVDFDS